MHYYLMFGDDYEIELTKKYVLRHLKEAARLSGVALDNAALSRYLENCQKDEQGNVHVDYRAYLDMLSYTKSIEE